MRRASVAIGAVLVLLLCSYLVAHRGEEHQVPGGAVHSPMLAGERIVYPAARPALLPLPGGRSLAVRSLLDDRRPMRFGDYLWHERGVPTGPVWVRVDLARQSLSVFRAGHEIGSTVILFGADGKPTPTGIFPVLAKAREHRSTLYLADMPYMLRLTGDGVAIHASGVREGAATHGCIGVPRAFARLLFDSVSVGDRVAIIGSAAS